MERLPYLLTVVFTILILMFFNSISQAQTSFNVSNKTTGDTLFTIDNTGKVGIGTTAPVAKLEVLSSDPDQNGSIRLGNSDLSNYIRLYSGTSIFPNPFIMWNEGSALRFGTSFGNEFARLTSEGNLGIGTTTPTQMLEVADTIRSTVGGFQFPDGTVQETAANVGSSTWQQNGSNIYYNSGNVGIGTSTPEFQLEISGNFGIRDSQLVYLPDQSNFEGTIYFGNGGNLLTSVGANYPRFNTVLGFNALYSNLTGARNTAIGYNALFANEGYNMNNSAEGDDNTAIGYNTLYANYGARNTAIGSEALHENRMGNDNTAIGYQTLQSLGVIPSFTYSGNTSVGSQIMTLMEHGEGNTIVGYKNFWQGDNYFDNTIIGARTAEDISEGSENVIIGQEAASNWQGALRNTIIGSKAGFATNGDYRHNVIIGYEAGKYFIPDENHWNDNLIIANHGYTPLILGEFDNNHLNINGSLAIMEPEDTPEGNAFLTKGYQSTASGDYSVATGIQSNALGDYSLAMGSYATATQRVGISIGEWTVALGQNSAAIGSFVETAGEGSFAIGDNSTINRSVFYTANQFNARFANGYNLYTDSDASIGVTIAASGNSWSSISDSSKKENFKTVDGEVFLDKISNFNLTSWNYKGQDPKRFRHYGPMAQDFYAAFGNDGVGTIGNDTTIASSDFDGINFIAIQALEKRTSQLQAKINEISDLKKDNQKLKDELSTFKSKIEKLESLFSKVEELTNANNNQYARNKDNLK